MGWAKGTEVPEKDGRALVPIYDVHEVSCKDQ